MSRYNMRKYPYGDGTETPEGSKCCRFMDIDLEDFLTGVAEKAMPDYKIGVYADIKKLHEAAESEDPSDRSVIWHISSYGTFMNGEKEAFIEDTPAFRYMTKDVAKTDMRGYIVEVSGYENNVLRGNVFEAGNNADYAWHIRKTALPLESVTLTYPTGLAIDVPHYEYARDYRHYMHDRGKVASIRYNPYASMTGMDGLLQKERMERMELPVGKVESHLEKLEREIYGKLAPIIQLRPEKLPIAEKLAVADRAAQLYNEQNKSINIPKEADNTIRI